MPDLRSIHNQQSAYQDSMLAAFEQHLRAIVMRAQAGVTGKLQRTLTIEDGIIAQTPANMRALRNLNTLFMREMDRAGLQQLLQVFVDEFNGQIPFLQEVLRYLSDQMETPLPGLTDFQFSKADANVFGAFKANAVSSLETVIEQAAGAAMTRSMFSVGGMKFADLVETLAVRFEQSIGKARTIADTSMSVFYATASERAFETIAGTQEAVIKYRYTGPVDKLERPFCRHLTDMNKAFTDEQISSMSNGQLPNVKITRGGWNCRHQWVLDTSELEVRALEAA
jgi:hypothetical protein